MTEAAVAVDDLQAADVHHEFTAEVAFDRVVVLEEKRDRGDVFVGQLARFDVRINFRAFDDFGGDGRTDSVDRTERIRDTLVHRDVNT